MTRWMYPPEIERERERARFDPIVEGARHRLSRELSLAIWDRVRADATDAAGRCDTELAGRRFHELAARIAVRGGRLRPDIGRATRVGVEAGDDWLASWTTELRLSAPGRDTLVASELRRWGRTGHAARLVAEDGAVTEGVERPGADRADRAGGPRRELPGAGDVARAMAALQRPVQDQVRPLRGPVPSLHAALRRREMDLRAWAPPGRAANDAVRPPDWLVRAGRAAQVGEAVRLQRAGELTEALRRGDPGLADAVAVALHDGAIVALHPVDALRDSVRALGAEPAVADHRLGRAVVEFLRMTRRRSVDSHVVATVDAATRGAAQVWPPRARGWSDGAARRAMALRDAAAAQGAEDELARLSASGGAPLPVELRARMEALFGHRFAHVRIHTDGAAAQAAETAGARAVTIGSHIYFARGQFTPGSEAGDRLLLHELTHVVQHDEGRLPEPANGRVELSSPSDPAEHEARAMEARVSEVRAVDARPRTAEAAPRAGQADAPAAPLPVARVVDPADRTARPRPAAGDAPRTGRRASPNVFGDAAHWVGDRIDDIENWAEDKIEALVAKVAPGLVTLIHEGPGGLIKDAIQPAVSSWVGSITGGVNLGQVTGQLKSSFSAAFAVLQGAKAGDAKCCETLVNGINAIREVAHAFMHNPVMDAIKGILTKVSDIVGTVTKLVIGPAFDVLKTIVGGAWDAIKSVASTVQGWFNAVKNVAGKAFDWVAKKLGFSSGTGEGGLLDWLKQKASEIWDKIKETLKPVIGPLKVVAGVLLMFTGLPQIYAIIKYGPQLVEAIQWLWANRNNPEAVKKNPGLIGGSILPKILGVGQSFVGMVKSGVAWLVDKTSAFVTGALQLAGAITGIPLLGMAKSFVQTLVDGIKGVQAWAAGAFTSAEQWLEGTFHKIADFIKPYAEVLCSVAMAIVNPGMIPTILAGWAWRWLPDCIKPPLIDLLLDAVITVLEGMPSLPMMGPLWPLLKSGVLGFLHALRAKDPATKIKVSNKLAKIISGASPMFLFGFVKGFLRGVWGGIKMPFEAIWLILKGLHKAVEFFDALGNEADTKAEKPATPNNTPHTQPKPDKPAPHAPSSTPPVSAPSVIKPDQIQGVIAGMATQLSEHKPPKPATPAHAPAAAAPAAGPAADPHANQFKQLGQEAHRMGGELAGPAATVTSNFMPAVQELFSSKGGGSIDDLMGKLGKVWEAAKAAIGSLGAKIANMSSSRTRRRRSWATPSATWSA
ncbi:MAG: DUF4157 domain-containing protein [Deltaproteobacteria bacterium]|nr:MAG: DUF4157 domain-containing protein [Deltaproteobacteria bacterium]